MDIIIQTNILAIGERKKNVRYNTLLWQLNVYTLEIFKFLNESQYSINENLQKSRNFTKRHTICVIFRGLDTAIIYQSHFIQRTHKPPLRR